METHSTGQPELGDVSYVMILNTGKISHKEHKWNNNKTIKNGRTAFKWTENDEFNL